MPLAMSENVAVPLSAATTRYGSSPSWRTTCLGGTTAPSTRLSVMSRSAEMNVVYEATPSASQASRSTAGSGSCLGRNPPFAPTGTMTAFLTACALTRPSTSVRKSSRRSDQRSPPRATSPKRRCTPSTRGLYTQISKRGRGRGRSWMADGSNLNDRYGLTDPSAAGWKKLVRKVAFTRPTRERRIRSSSRLATWSSSCSMACSTSAQAAARSPSSVGSQRRSNSLTSSRASCRFATRHCSTYAWLKVEPACRR